jgi:hypothetical protein
LLLQLLDIGADIMRPDRRRRQAAVLAPSKEPAAGARIGAARVRVTDVGRKEFDVAPRRGVAEIGDQRRNDIRRPLVDGDLGLLNGGWQLRCRLV